MALKTSKPLRGVCVFCLDQFKNLFRTTYQAFCLTLVSRWEFAFYYGTYRSDRAA
jgi:hypothetical protein